MLWILKHLKLLRYLNVLWGLFVLKNFKMSDQIKIPCMFMRGSTSRGPYFLKTDLPEDIAKRDKIVLAVMGSPDVRQIDGLGGAEPVKSKVAIIDKSK